MVALVDEAQRFRLRQAESADAPRAKRRRPILHVYGSRCLRFGDGVGPRFYLGARSRDHTRGRELSSATARERSALLPVFGWLLPRLARSLARSVRLARLARRRRASVSVASRTLVSPGNSGYVATALYNGGRTWNRLAKVARVPGCCVENREW